MKVSKSQHRRCCDRLAPGGVLASCYVSGGVYQLRRIEAGMTDTQHLYASPEASQVAVAQPVQEELLGDTGCTGPVGGQLSYCGLRWQIAMAIRRANSFADAQIAGDYTGRPRVRARNHSAVHRPRPRHAVRQAITSASGGHAARLKRASLWLLQWPGQRRIPPCVWSIARRVGP